MGLLMDENVEHQIFTDSSWSANRSYWECSCGKGGSAEDDRVDIASDKHIKPGETRVDISKPRW